MLRRPAHDRVDEPPGQGGADATLVDHARRSYARGPRPEVGRWDPDEGDPVQRLVLIGHGLDEGGQLAALDACLLDDDELALGTAGWAALPDPFLPGG